MEERQDYRVLETDGYFQTCPLCFGHLVFDGDRVTQLNDWCGYSCSQCGARWFAGDLADIYSYNEM